ncbi:MAG: hypothetical protein ACFFBE_01270 [Promethearchaeota archaeon]
MQQYKKPEEMVRENLELRTELENLRKEVETMKSSLKTTQVEIDRILKTLTMKPYGEEFRERMENIERRTFF